MLNRLSYGEAKVRVTYNVRPGSEAAFEAVSELKVKMLHLPQAGQEVRVSFDRDRREKIDVLTLPGEEGGRVLAETAVIPWAESARQSYQRQDGTRGYR